MYDLQGYVIPADGHFLGANAATFTLAPAQIDFDTGGIDRFENSDNVTHLLVAGFTGAMYDVLDTDRDGTIDITPWTEIVDWVSLVEMLTPATEYDEFVYDFSPAPGAIVGPDGSYVPGHVQRIPDGSGPWQIGEFDLGVDDTPGVLNDVGACCWRDWEDPEPGKRKCTDGLLQEDCEALTNSEFKGPGTTCGDIACPAACCVDDVCNDVTGSTECAGLSGQYQGDEASCLDVPEPCTDCKTIAEARALPLGTGVRLCDVIMTSRTNLSGAGYASFQIQDVAEPTAATVFGEQGLINGILSGVADGDRISLQGTTGQYSGLFQIQDGIKPLVRYGAKDAGPVPDAVTVTAATFDHLDDDPTAESYESEIVEVLCGAFLEQGLFAAYQAGPPYMSGSYTLVDDTGKAATVHLQNGGLDWQGYPIPEGVVSVRGILNQYAPWPDYVGGYQFMPRGIWTVGIEDLDESPDCGPVGACCLFTYDEFDDSCRDGLTADACAALGGMYQGDETDCTTPCPVNDSPVINEIRIDQPGDDDDEYFELKGTVGTPLGGLTYISIGGAGDTDSGLIEAVVPLRRVLPADGVLFVAEDEDTFGAVADQVSNVDFQNSENQTHMLVQGFTSYAGEDLDTNDDGVLDSTPWTRIIDDVAVIVDPAPPTDSYYFYSSTTVGPDGTLLPGHVYLCPNETPPPDDVWVIGEYDLYVDDSPGVENIFCSEEPQPCLCKGDLYPVGTGDGKRNGLDIAEFVAALLDPTYDWCADMNGDWSDDDADIAVFVQALLDGEDCPVQISVVSWNVFNWSGGPDRVADYQTVLDQLDPDILMVQEITNGSTGASSFLTDVLNPLYGAGVYAMADFTSGGGDTDNALYYRTGTVSYTPGDHTDIAADPREIDRWKVRPLAAPEYDLYVYSMHLKSGTAGEDEDKRAAAAASVRADTDALPAGAHFVLGGDYNIYESGDDGYVVFTCVDGVAPCTSTDPDGQAWDPIDEPGYWHDSATFAEIHTQSTHADNAGAPTGAATGGMDDRYDIILVSGNLLDSVGLDYVINTYKAYGQDGLHLNNDINDAPVIPEGQAIADALHAASDHMPVYMELEFPPE
ncbi:MAG: endonuclease/exonuclease/phosphatase family protein [Planctomycetes bacterium]|nr:endonuclease/exonuclease/phosphatase family protein [Planctomycetota bacterium]